MATLLEEESLGAFYEKLSSISGIFEVTLADGTIDRVVFKNVSVWLTGLSINIFSKRNEAILSLSSDDILKVNGISVSSHIENGYGDLQPLEMLPTFEKNSEGLYEHIVKSPILEEIAVPTRSVDPRVLFSVTEITRQIKEQLTSPQFQEIWVVGELCNVTYSTSGHIYFSLKDETSVISGVIFRRSAIKLKFKLENGINVELFGSISLYEPRGSYQIVAEHLSPEGKGELQLAYEQLKEKLEKEGLFETSRKRPIPRFPKNIGIVTSPTGAAIRDMLKTTHNNFKNLNIILYPSKVQGEGSSIEIAAQIAKANEDAYVDVLIVGRGGGSTEDLWCFNEEPTLRAIYNSKIPVISAVGHEIDYTLSDFVADFRCVTPTAAAEKVTEGYSELTQSLPLLENRVARAVKGRIEKLNARIEACSVQRIKQSLIYAFDTMEQRHDDLYRRAGRAIAERYKDFENRFLRIATKLDALSPFKVLGRGYSVVFKEGKVVSNAGDVNVNDTLNVKLFQGELEVAVLKREVSEVREGSGG